MNTYKKKVKKVQHSNKLFIYFAVIWKILIYNCQTIANRLLKFSMRKEMIIFYKIMIQKFRECWKIVNVSLFIVSNIFNSTSLVALVGLHLCPKSSLGFSKLLLHCKSNKLIKTAQTTQIILETVIKKIIKASLM